MPEYIEREAAITAIRNLPFFEHETCTFIDSCDAEDEIDSIPAADVAPVVHGRWEHGSSLCDPFCEVWKCSYCSAEDENGMCYNFCPNCGAKMQGDSDDEK